MSSADPVPPPVDTAEAERLAAAEGWWVYWEYSGSLTDVGTAEQRAAARVLHAEYDRRGAALDAARADVERLTAQRAAVEAAYKELRREVDEAEADEHVSAEVFGALLGAAARIREALGGDR